MDKSTKYIYFQHDNQIEELTRALEGREAGSLWGMVVVRKDSAKVKGAGQNLFATLFAFHIRGPERKIITQKLHD